MKVTYFPGFSRYRLYFLNGEGHLMEVMLSPEQRDDLIEKVPYPATFSACAKERYTGEIPDEPGVHSPLCPCRPK